MKRVAIALFAAGIVLPAAAQSIGAEGFIDYAQNGSSYDYVVTLHNTGSTTIGTFWYSWIPGSDFMSVMPVDALAPTGWNAAVQGGTGGNGYSVEFTAQTAGDYLQAGGTLTGFKFTSTETPDELMANSPIPPNDPTGTSFVYEHGPFSGQSLEFVVNPVPEPISLLALAPAALLMRRRRPSR